MEVNVYKETLKDALLNLIKVNESIFNSIVPIALHGELKDWSDSVPIGETHQFPFSIFQNSDDINIQKLVKLIEEVDSTYQSIKNINCIEIEEE